VPHLILAGETELARRAGGLGAEAHRWGRAVVKIEDCWVRADGSALLVEGVVVEFSRPLHPVALVAPHHGRTIVRLWARSAVERTEAVQRWLGLVAEGLCRSGGLALESTNIADEVLAGLEL
jgi:hypothetical protein